MKVGITPSRSRRWTGVAALAYVALGVVAGFDVTHSSKLQATWSGTQVSTYVAAHHATIVGDAFTSALLVAVLVVLAALLRRAFEQAGELIGSLLVGFAAASAALLLGSLGSEIAMVQLGSRTSVAGVEALWRISIGLQVIAALPLALFFGLSALASWRSRALPRWCAVVALAVAGVEIGAGLIYQVTRTWGHLDSAGALPSMAWALVLGCAFLLERRPARVARRAGEAVPSS